MSGVLTSDRILEDSLSGATSGRRGFLLSESPASEAPSAASLDEPVNRYGAVRQYSLAKIVGVGGGSTADGVPRLGLCATAQGSTRRA